MNKHQMKIYKIMKEFSLGDVGYPFDVEEEGHVLYKCNRRGPTITIEPHEIDILLALGFIEEVKEEKKGRITEMLKDGDEYWCIDWNSQTCQLFVDLHGFSNRPIHRYYLKTGMMFWDKESAEEALKEIMNG